MEVAVTRVSMAQTATDVDPETETPDLLAELVRVAADRYEELPKSRTKMTKGQRNSQIQNAVHRHLDDEDVPLNAENAAAHSKALDVANKLAFDGDYTAEDAREYAGRVKASA